MDKYVRQLVDAIEYRHSVRTYASLEIAEETLEKIRDYIEEIVQEYENAIRIVLVEVSEDHQTEKLGTYGVIKGARYFLIAACRTGEYDQLILGYALEKIVLYATSFGLATVWLGGTYKKGQFAKAMNLKDGEEIKIVVPLGYEASTKSFVARLMGDHSKKRKDFGSIYFDRTVKIPLTLDGAESYRDALLNMRKAPSAINRQPWRVIKEDNKLHFYATDFKGSHKIDLGIGLAHFHLTVQKEEIPGEFVWLERRIDSPFAYVVSWVPKK